MRQVNKAERERWAEGKNKSWRERKRECARRETDGWTDRQTLTLEVKAFRSFYSLRDIHVYV